MGDRKAIPPIVDEGASMSGAMLEEPRVADVAETLTSESATPHSASMVVDPAVTMPPQISMAGPVAGGAVPPPPIETI